MLRDDMAKLVERAHDMAKDFRNDPDPHLQLCHGLSDEFNLWTETEDGEGERFPIWLSRVVEGVLRDADENYTGA